ncbi:hypothetical protein ACFFUB_04135 [Algimonas porphyrae]|uniref:DUF2834 domain-containing protein n=1 Tax=Algimonas porphyrae TaxID=1128113 RepID=A0ABQ5V081_9PROT|nr:hypothetical protein [Algimonas porphyrae]GLQ20045.1 hypothetical protein GCM10007854_10000 [Algimonas porphyrae]
MTLFRMFLFAILSAIIVYTAIVMINHGPNLLPVFFNDMLAMGWPGQFNLDFMTFLMLSAIWVAWRNGFSPMSWILALLAFFGGMLFLSVYLLILTSRHKGDMATILMGPSRTGS